jgi:uncharacterized protein (DUF1697 family)
MPRFVAFLRAVNVGGRVVKSDTLKKGFESAGAADPETFLASGNVIFSSKMSRGHEAKLSTALAASLSFEVPVFVRTLEEVAVLAAHRAFPEKDVARFPTYLVGFLSKELDAAGVERLSALESPEDRFHVRGRDFWWLSKHHQARPAITGRQLEKALGQPTTLRNVNTVRRMAERFGPISARRS